MQCTRTSILLLLLLLYNIHAIEMQPKLSGGYRARNEWFRGSISTQTSLWGSRVQQCSMHTVIKERNWSKPMRTHTNIHILTYILYFSSDIGRALLGSFGGRYELPSGLSIYVLYTDKQILNIQNIIIIHINWNFCTEFYTYQLYSWNL